MKNIILEKFISAIPGFILSSGLLFGFVGFVMFAFGGGLWLLSVVLLFVLFISFFNLYIFRHKILSHKLYFILGLLCGVGFAIPVIIYKGNIVISFFGMLFDLPRYFRI